MKPPVVWRVLARSAPRSAGTPWGVMPRVNAPLQ
jgi:hypothetical protein